MNFSMKMNISTMDVLGVAFGKELSANRGSEFGEKLVREFRSKSD